MKKNIYICLSVLLSSAIFISCDDSFLERYPLDGVSPYAYFKSENEIIVYTNQFYTMLPTAVEVYGEKADNIATYALDKEISGDRDVPTTDGQWDWSDLRKINFHLNNSFRCENKTIRAKYDGLARFFRAYFYYKKVKRYGDVPWYSVVIETNDKENLMRPRDSRTLIMDSIMADINYAIATLDKTKSDTRITKWTALALKSRICLFEGTFRKYHTEFNLPNADYFLEECYKASAELMKSGYKIYTATTGVTGKPYQDLFVELNSVSDEVILTRRYDNGLGLYHNLQFYLTASTQGKPGMEKTLVNSYLMDDGTPFTDKEGYEKLMFSDEMVGRDPRLAQTIRIPGYSRIGESKFMAPDFESTVSGYQLIKFMNKAEYDQSSRSFGDMPIFRYAEVLLNYAEAKAELGILKQEDIDISIKLLRDRIGMTNLNIVTANATPDLYQAALYPNVEGANKGVILEIRRERRVELVMEGFRWDDLMRYKAGQLLAKPFTGMYFPGTGEYNLDGKGGKDVVIYSGEQPAKESGIAYIPVSDLTEGTKGYVMINKGAKKMFQENKDYFWPIAIEERVLNPNLSQNLNWEDGLGY